MKKILIHLGLISFLLFIAHLSTASVLATPGPCPVGETYPRCNDVIVQTEGIFKIPSFGDILTFAIRFFFTIAGIAALFMLLLGALEWVMSGGAKENIGKARDKIQAAVVGMIVLVLVLAIIWTMENVVFQRRICFGLSCPVTIPGLIKGAGAGSFICSNKDGSICYSADDAVKAGYPKAD